MVDEDHLLVGFEEEKLVKPKTEAKKNPVKRRSLRRWQRGMRRVRTPLSLIMSLMLTTLSHHKGAVRQKKTRVLKGQDMVCQVIL